MAGPVTEHGYPFNTIRADYLRAAIGFAFGFVPLVAGDAPLAVAIVLGGLAAMFAAYGLVTFGRQMMRLRVGDQGLQVTGWRPVELPWNELKELRLSFYSTKRDKKSGWMQLRLRGQRGMVRVESTLEGFDTVVRRAGEAAAANGVALDEVSLSNFQALGVPWTGEEAPQ